MVSGRHHLHSALWLPAIHQVHDHTQSQQQHVHAQSGDVCTLCTYHDYMIVLLHVKLKTFVTTFTHSKSNNQECHEAQQLWLWCVLFLLRLERPGGIE